MRGWWEMTSDGIKAEMFDESEVNETSWEHIHGMVREGYIEGELVQEGE